MYKLLLLTLLSFPLIAPAQVERDTPRPIAVEEPAGPKATPPLPPELTPGELARQQKEAEEAAKKGCAVCGGGLAAVGAVGLAAIALNIALMVRVARDAKARGMDSSVLWMFLVMATGLIGLLIYILSRPQGLLAVCQTCGGKRLAVSAVCPHCRNP